MVETFLFWHDVPSLQIHVWVAKQTEINRLQYFFWGFKKTFSKLQNDNNIKNNIKNTTKKLFKLTPTFLTYFLYCFCVIFEEIRWRFFTFQYLFKMLIRFNLKYIADFLTPNSFTISINLLDSLNWIKMQPCLYVTSNMLFFYNLMIVSHSLAIGIAPL